MHAPHLSQFPEAQFPEAQFPEAQFPEAQFPEAQFPEAQFPEAQFPEAQFPEARSHNSLNRVAPISRSAVLRASSALSNLAKRRILRNRTLRE
jgi:hypothetical protein